MTTQSPPQDWIREVIDTITRLNPRYAQLYAEDGNLPHYRHLHNILRRRFKDEVLARAGFLHGVSLDKLRTLSDSLVSPEILAILEEREILRALDMDEPERTTELLTEALPDLRHSRSIVLFVIEQLHHLDPDGRLERWSKQFHHHPAHPPKALPGPGFKQPAELDRLPTFARRVVAPTAAFFGLWHERNILEDAALWTCDPERFHALVEFAIKERGAGGLCDALEQLILGTLEPMRTMRRPRWEWRHVASLDQQLDREKKTLWRRHLYRAGFVTVVCDDAEDCYRALYRLHRRFRHRSTEQHDTVSHPTASGYRALHTVLSLDPLDARDDSSCSLPCEAVAVRMIPAQNDLERRSPAGYRRLKSLQERFHSRGGHGLRVITFDGKVV